MARLIAISAAGFALLLASWGCDKKERTATSSDGAVTVTETTKGDQKTTTVTVTGKDPDIIKTSTVKNDIKSLDAALGNFEVDCGRLPSTDEDLAALVTKPTANAGAWKGPYVSRLPVDPWGARYVYEYPGQHNPGGYDLYATQGGKDPGGSKFNNWVAEAKGP
ncbi:MAG TPA: type II secretion system protein GspG [Tepidisphaeraceae bacterium]|jgi:type II secretion system protein G